MAEEEKGDHWGLLPGIDPGDLSILQDYQEFSRTPRGERILEHLRIRLHADETTTTEEQLSAALIEGGEGRMVQIDPIAYWLRAGMRRAWSLIDSHVRALERLEQMRRKR